jgi:hypothetical protein
MQQEPRNRKPRAEYGARALMPLPFGKLGEARAYGKAPGAARGSVTLPEAWSVVCPNRITERRADAGMEFVSDLHRAIGSISYQRLVKMEIGRVIIRDSEYELVADALGINEADLRMPLLTHEETIAWNRKWGSRTQIEEGGDEDSVLLAAYVRYLVERTGKARAAICDDLGAPGNCLSGIWYAEKPIDRWPDSTMTVVIRLAEAANWDDVITTSRTLHGDGLLDDHVTDVIKPRIRYAPEDPDRKAPWTYETDAFRTHKPKRQVRTPLSAEPLAERSADRMLRERTEARTAKRGHREVRRAQFARMLDDALAADPLERLKTLFPDTPNEALTALAGEKAKAAYVISRATLVRETRNTADRAMVAELLDVTEERVRQIVKKDDGTLKGFLPKGKTVMRGGFDA